MEIDGSKFCPPPSQSSQLLSRLTTKTSAKFFFLILLLLILYREVFRNLVFDWWNDENFSHGFLIPLLSGYFVWERRKRLAELPIQWHWSGFVVLITGLLLLIAGVVGAEFFLTRISLLFLIAGMILIFLGWGHLKELLFPIAVLILMIPIPAIIFNNIAFPLQVFASKCAVALLETIGVPALREGNIIYLPNTSLEVVEACSGIRSLVSLITLSLAFAYFSHRSLWARIIITLSSIPVAVLANAIRVSGTGLLAYFISPEMADGFFHQFSGWLVFLVAFLLLVCESWLIKKWSRYELPESVESLGA